MDNTDSHTQILFDNRISRLKSYRLRFLNQILWYLLILGTPTILLYRKDGLISLYILVPFIIVWIIWDYLDEKRFKYRTLLILLDTSNDKLFIENVDRKDRQIKMSIDLKKSRVKLKELRLGRLNVPGYELIICEGSEVVYRQNDSSIISRRTIKKVAKQIIEYQVEKGRQQKPMNLIQKLKKKSCLCHLK